MTGTSSLFLAKQREQSAGCEGLLSYIAFMELLKKFRITHTFETSSELQALAPEECSGEDGESWRLPGSILRE